MVMFLVDGTADIFNLTNISQSRSVLEKMESCYTVQVQTGGARHSAVEEGPRCAALPRSGWLARLRAGMGR